MGSVAGAEGVEGAAGSPMLEVCVTAGEAAVESESDSTGEGEEGISPAAVSYFLCRRSPSSKDTRKLPK